MGLGIGTIKIIIALSYLRTYVLGWLIYDTYVYEFLRMYPGLRTTIYEVPYILFKNHMNIRI